MTSLLQVYPSEISLRLATAGKNMLVLHLKSYLSQVTKVQPPNFLNFDPRPHLSTSISWQSLQMQWSCLSTKTFLQSNLDTVVKFLMYQGDCSCWFLFQVRIGVTIFASLTSRVRRILDDLYYLNFLPKVMAKSTKGSKKSIVKKTYVECYHGSHVVVPKQRNSNHLGVHK